MVSSKLIKWSLIILNAICILNHLIFFGPENAKVSIWLEKSIGICDCVHHAINHCILCVCACLGYFLFDNNWFIDSFFDPIIFHINFVLLALVPFALGGFLFGVASTKDMKRILQVISDSTKVEENSTSISKNLFEFIQLHSNTKQLSVIEAWNWCCFLLTSKSACFFYVF